MKVKDLSPFDPSPDEEAWLGRLRKHLETSDHVVRLGDAAEPEGGDIVTRDSHGTWWAGRYIGEVYFEGHRLTIEPRLGMEVIEEWLAEALNLTALPQPSRDRPTESFIALLLAMVWSQRLAAASRHGPPAFRRERHTHGPFLRGRLDIRGTLALRERALPQLASVTRLRDLDNDVCRVIVSAERTLTDAVGHDRWHSSRVAEVLPTLRAAVGFRPRVPRRSDLRRVRYAPITRPFEQVAELSWQIANLRGVTSGVEPGKSAGLLLDVAELWELFVLNCLRQALPPTLQLDHGTHAEHSDYFMRSRDGDKEIGKLKPDLLIRDGDTVFAVLDAKYKRLRDSPPERPRGIEPGDLYQIAAYSLRYRPSWGAALLYPLSDDSSKEEISYAELYGPWESEAGTISFRRLPVDVNRCRAELSALLRFHADDPVATAVS